jgi:hypothetical protein
MNSVIQGFRFEQKARAVDHGKDINARIGLLVSSLSELKAEFDDINKTIEEGILRLCDSDLDLTSKVSVPDKRLGEIENTCKVISINS